MNKISSTKTFTFALAHLLSGHQGLCKNLHGHNYKLEVTAVADELPAFVRTSGPSEGMVVDFKDLKNIVNELIIEPLDHATMIWNNTEDPFEKELRELLFAHNKKCVDVVYRPTAENMAREFMLILNDALEARNALFKIEKVKIWETDTSFSIAE